MTEPDALSKCRNYKMKLQGQKHKEEVSPSHNSHFVTLKASCVHQQEVFVI